MPTTQEESPGPSAAPGTGSGTKAVLELRDLSKEFTGQVAVDSVDLEVNDGEFVSLLGPSGSGKTTTLRMIAGFERPTSGTIVLEGTDVQDVPAHKRPINTVFQDYALFPHLSVEQNVAFGLKAKRVSREEISRRVREALELVELGPLAGRAPGQLSGGQRQRAALARALVLRPRLLLLDEPLGALDLKLRRSMQLVLMDLCRQLGITFLYVTHDQEEALTMSDRIAVMNEGRVEQYATPEDLYRRPRSSFVAGFVGENNLVRGTLRGRADDGCVVELGGVRLEVQGDSLHGVAAGSAVLVALRPEALRLMTDPAPEEITGTVAQSVFVGADARVIVDVGEGEEITVRVPPASIGQFERGRPVWIACEPGAASAFPAEPA
jgi:spermidine/putrescine transport system ATP-binding protein